MPYHVKDINNEQQFHDFVEKIKKIDEGNGFLTDKLGETGKLDGRIVTLLKTFARNVLHIDVTTTSKKAIAQSIKQFVIDNRTKFEIKQNDIDVLVGILRKLEKSEKNKKVFEKAIRTIQTNERPLTYALLKNDTRAVLDLLHDGADPNIPDSSGLLPIHRAVLNGNRELVEKLCTDENINSALPEKGFTPLFLALNTKNKGLIQFLLDKGADRTIRDKKVNLPIHYLTGKEQLDLFKMLYTEETKDAVGERGRSLISMAILSNNIELVRFLINQRVDLSKHDDDGKTTLTLAIDKAHETKDFKIVTLLMQAQGLSPLT